MMVLLWMAGNCSLSIGISFSLLTFFFFIVFIVANYHVTIPFVMLISMPSKFK